MDSLRRLMTSEIFLATMPPSVMLFYYFKREREFDAMLKDVTSGSNVARENAEKDS